MTFEEFWKMWDRLMDKEMYNEAWIFLYSNYKEKWNRGK